MSSKILLLSFMFILNACGVKGDPTPPKEVKTPSLMENYPDIKTDKPVDDVKKK